MQRRGNTETEMQGRYPQEGQYVNDPHAPRSANQQEAKAGRHWGIWLLLGLLFLKFSVLLVLMSLMFIHFHSRTSELQRNVENLRKILPSCESGWLEFEGHCYFLSDVELNWTNSEEMCCNRSSHLVVINNEAEQKFLLDNYKEISWIGLTDLEKEGVFKWIDGTELSFQFWNKGEPNDLGDNEDCAQISGEGWNDSICGVEFYAICEKSLM